jgi:hypothetical protein
MQLGTNHPWVKRIKNCSNKVPGLVQRGDNYKNKVKSFKSLLLKNHKVRKIQIYMTAS